MSAPYFLKMSAGSTPLPRDLCMALPSPSTVQPWVTHSLKGAPLPKAPTAVSREDWNQPRYWSRPSRYMVAGQKPWSFFMEAKWVEPESNQPSRVSSSLVKGPLLPQWGQVKPWGRISAAERSYQALEPFSAKRALTAAMVSSVQMGLPQSGQ